MPRLSVVIPSRNEQFLLPTIQDILKNRRLDTEVIAILDGAWPTEPLPDHPDVHLVYHPVSIGQRAATNEGVRISRAEFVMKADGHVAFDEGFDAKLIGCYDSGELDRTVTSIPAQHRLHCYNRRCKACGYVDGQGPMDAKCVKCEAKGQFEMQMVWKPRRTPTTSWVADSVLHYQYDAKDRCRLNRGCHDVMTGLGACFLLKRDRYHELDGFDESIGSWGQFSQELSCKTWLSGGRQVCNTNTWFAHFFKVGGIGMGYPLTGTEQERARKRARDIWFNNRWKGQKLPLEWWVRKFLPIHNKDGPRWDDDALAKLAKASRAFTSSRSHLLAMGSGVSLLLGESGGSVSGVIGAGTSLDDVAVGDVVRPVGCDLTDHARSDAATIKPSVGVTALAVSQNVGADRSVAALLPPDVIHTHSAGPIDGASGGSSRRGQEMAARAMSLRAVNAGDSVTSPKVLNVRDESQVGGIAAFPVVADDVVKLGNASPVTERQRFNEERVQKSMHPEAVVDSALLTEPRHADLAVAVLSGSPGPVPAASCSVDLDLGEDARESLAVEVRDREILGVSHAVPPRQVPDRSGAAGVESLAVPIIIRPTVGVLYITNNVLDERIFDACLRQLKRAVNGHRVVSVSHKPVDLGQNILFSPTTSPHLNYFRQLALGVEALDVDVVYIAEHDCAMPRDHFYLVPTDADAFYYNENCWRVDANTGRAVTHEMRSVSGLCASRALLLDHYRKMVARVERRGYYYKWGHEPGLFPGRIDPVTALPAVGWRSAKPYVDIRHSSNLTGSRWSPDKFEVPPTGWQESDGVPGWGKTLGRFDEWLQEVAR